jgi:hypothetical protein
MPAPDIPSRLEPQVSLPIRYAAERVLKLQVLVYRDTLGLVWEVETVGTPEKIDTVVRNRQLFPAGWSRFLKSPEVYNHLRPCSFYRAVRVGDEGVPRVQQLRITPNPYLSGRLCSLSADNERSWGWLEGWLTSSALRWGSRALIVTRAHAEVIMAHYERDRSVIPI